MSNVTQTFSELSERYLECFENGEVPTVPVGVRLIPHGAEVPQGSAPPEEYMGMPWCHAVRLAATEDEVVVINADNVGCPAAAIALGLVSEQQTTPLGGKRRYTDLMSGEAASPANFTNGLVYACRDTDHMQYALFGKEDTGRYETLGVALKAISGMKSIQPPTMQAAVAYPASKLDQRPDVVILSVKPKQALLAIQGINYLTGDRFEMSTIGIRGVCADVTAEPYLEQRLNGSFYCLGARALGGWEGSQLALGMPCSVFEQMVAGMKQSGPGFPYKAYPG